MTICDANGVEQPDLIPVDDICSDSLARLAPSGCGKCGGKCGSAAAVEAVLAFAREQKLAATDVALLLNSLPR